MYARYALNNYNTHAFNAIPSYYRLLEISVRLLEITGDYHRLLQITGDYQRLPQITTDYWRLPEITIDYYRLLEITRDYWRLRLLK